MDEVPEKAFYPEFRDSNANFTSVSEANKMLEDVLIKYNAMNASYLPYNTSLPDAVMVLNDVDEDKGFSYNYQSNNILYSTYHRLNSWSVLNKYSHTDYEDGKKTRIYPTILTVTEGFISGINLNNNLFLNKKKNLGLKAQKPFIWSFVSPTVDDT